MQNNSLDYKKAGVDIDSADKLIDDIRILAKKTRRVEVISGVGGFAGLFSLANRKMKKPVLVASTDGVGTKLKLAIDLKHFDGLGQDLVAMCVNDLVCCGAEPLFFLDYFATGKLNRAEAKSILTSITKALIPIKCTLLGGETAEMPGLYNEGDFDLAGFAVGIVEEDSIVDGSSVGLGDRLIGLASTGVHSNGFSLVRKILTNTGMSLDARTDFAPEGIGRHLLTPTQIYVKPALAVLKNHGVHALAHITGGGIVDNLPRVLPQACMAIIEKKKIPVPPVFPFLQELGHVSDEEMWRVFNMGIGFIIVANKDLAPGLLNQLSAAKVPAYDIGEIVKNPEGSEPHARLV